MKLAFVVHRYGADIAGGSETHCRGMAMALRSHEVEVLTTCARDYISWKNELPEGRTEVDGIPVTRFPTVRQRNADRFGELSSLVFYEQHDKADENRWIMENGPVCPSLVRAVRERKDVDFFLVYSYRYYTAFMSAAAAADRAVLIPTAEDDPAVHLEIFRGLFRSMRGILYLTPEEQELVESASGTRADSAIIGSGLTLPEAVPGTIARFDLPESYLLYVGRIDRNKGIDKLFRDYVAMAAAWPDAPALLLAGPQALDIPVHPKIHYLGYVTDDEKATVLSRASVVVMPSAFESLSILVLEAWAMGRPVLANARCRVLEGQCRRSAGGLYYRDMAEFDAMVRLLMSQPDLRARLGCAGRAYVAREYSWDIAASRTEALLNRLLRDS